MNTSALGRFARKVRHDPYTGCVVWTGGTTSGRAGEVRFGSFWFEGRRWLAHRWAAKFIHGLQIEEREVICECNNTLCVQHLLAIEPAGNTRQKFALLHKGVVEPEPEEAHQPNRTRLDLPYYPEPDWLLPFVPETQRARIDPDATPF